MTRDLISTDIFLTVYGLFGTFLRDPDTCVTEEPLICQEITKSTLH
jgi:hypothetical protein